MGKKCKLISKSLNKKTFLVGEEHEDKISAQLRVIGDFYSDFSVK